jgi:hypothetical protein
MSYIGPPFAFDIFVSYSHGDDGNGHGLLQPWSAAFATELERELRSDRRFRQTLTIFLDQDGRPGAGVDPMAPLTDQLKTQIGGAGVLLVLMSPDYLASAWCKDEREWWCGQQAAAVLPADERIAIVRIWPTTDPWPSAFEDSRGQPFVGFPFYTEGEPPRPLGWTDLPGPFGSDFRKALLNIVGRLCPKLDAMKARVDEQTRAKEGAAKLAQQGGQSIYLQGRSDRAAEWERAGLELSNSGFVVVPGEPDSIERDPLKLCALRERRVEALSGCDALLLLGTDDTRALDADLVVVGKLDRQSARARSNHLLPCGLLDTVGPSIATPVRKASARALQADWIDATKDPWTPAVQQWLADKGHQSGLLP